MYLAVDIGGTKTLVGTFTDDGKLLETAKFPTTKEYNQFILDLEKNVVKIATKDLVAIGVAIPGLIVREKGIVHSLGNLPWRDEKIRDDISAKFNDVPVIIENDAKAAGLSEALLLKNKYQDVFYATVSTGIGGALVQEGKIVRALRDMEIGKMPVMHEGKLIHWEDFAGGRGVVEHFGKRASDITDKKDWETVGLNIAYGLGIGCSILQPEVIVLDGGVGQFADKFSDVIMAYLQKNLHANVRHPKAILTAQRPNEAVLYGCYEIVKQYYG